MAAVTNVKSPPHKHTYPLCPLLSMLADVMTKVLAVSAFFVIRTMLMNLNDRTN